MLISMLHTYIAKLLGLHATSGSKPGAARQSPVRDCIAEEQGVIGVAVVARAVILATLVLVACRGGAQTQPASPDLSLPAADLFLGWTHGLCLGTERPVPAGTRVWVKTPEGDLNGVETLATTTEATEDNCPPLLEDRAAVNLERHVFQLLDSREGLHAGSDPAVAFVDPSSKGWRDAELSYCLTNEGIRFDVRSDSFQWTGYYYLGVDTEPTCDRTEEEGL